MREALRILGARKFFRFVWSEALCFVIRMRIVPPPIRVVLLRLAGARIGRAVVVHDITIINAYSRGFGMLELGDHTFLGHEVLLDLANEITLGSQVTFAPRVSIYTHRNVGYPDHPLQEKFGRLDRGVHIGSGSFLGAQVIVLPGAQIGERVFVDAGVIIKMECPPDTVLKAASRKPSDA